LGSFQIINWEALSTIYVNYQVNGARKKTRKTEKFEYLHI